MTPLVGVLVLILLGLAGARISFGAGGPLVRRLPLSAGMHLLFLGFILGTHVLGLLTREVIDQLYPFLALGLGWIGLLFGLQLDRRHLREFPRAFLWLALAQALVTFGVFWGLGEVAMALLPGVPRQARIGLLAAAATACVSTPVAIALVADTYRVRGRLAQLLFFVASLDAIVGILALQATYAFHHPHTFRALAVLPVTLPALAPVAWLLLATGLGIAFGVLFLGLTRPEPEREELVLFLLGLVIFAGGAALYMGVSPLFVCGIAGAVLTNLSPLRRQVYVLLQGWEKPTYAILLILAGALLHFPSWIILPLGLLYVLVRMLGKLAGGWVGTRVTRLRFSAPGDVGLALLPQGGISIAMAISVTLSYPALRLDGGLLLGEIVFSTVVLGVLASELVGPLLTRNVLRRAGEISPRTEDQVAEGVGTPGAGFPAAQRRRSEE
ncbi:MAG TPA: cation:proton antiporter [Longimicrobiales bacterium]|nr:cation:proton antiporter [Longimicrobiales bacterium]